LPRLDIVGEMVADPTGISEIRNFDRNDLYCGVVALFWGGLGV
jgi:hypothetical protein